MTIDYSKIRVGDVVGVRVIRDVVPVTDTAPGSVTVADGWGGDAIIHPSAIVSHTPAPKPALKVGDHVLWVGSGEREVGLIDGEFVYLRPNNPGASIYPLTLSEVETWERV